MKRRKGDQKLAKVTNQNVLSCKRVKGGRAACWIKEKGTIVFRFVSKERLKRLGIPLRTGKRGRVAMTLTGGYTFDGKNCRDSQNKFVPVSQCTGRRPKGRKKAAKRKKS